MRDPDRIDEVLDALRQHWKQNPDLRLAQIIGNAGRVKYGPTPNYVMEDDEVLAYLRAKEPQG